MTEVTPAKPSEPTTETPIDQDQDSAGAADAVVVSVDPFCGDQPCSHDGRAGSTSERDSYGSR